MTTSKSKNASRPKNERRITPCPTGTQSEKAEIKDLIKMIAFEVRDFDETEIKENVKISLDEALGMDLGSVDIILFIRHD